MEFIPYKGGETDAKENNKEKRRQKVLLLQLIFLFFYFFFYCKNFLLSLSISVKTSAAS